MMLTDKGESAGAAALYNQAAAHGLFPDPFQRAPYLVAETIAAVAWPEMEHWPVLVKAKGAVLPVRQSRRKEHQRSGTGTKSAPRPSQGPMT